MDTALMKLNNLFFEASSNKVAKTEQNLQNNSSLSFRKIFNSVTKKSDKVRDDNQKTEKNSDGEKFVAMSNFRLPRVIVHGDKKNENVQNQDGFETLQGAQKIDSKGDGQLSGIILNLILSLLQNIPDQHSKLMQETINSINHKDFPSVEDIKKALNLLEALNSKAVGQDKVLNELFTLTNRISKDNDNPENVAIEDLVAHLIFQSNNTLTLSLEGADNLGDKVGVKNGLFEILKSIFQKIDEKTDTSDHFVVASGNSASDFIKDVIQFLSKSIKSSKQFINATEDSVNLKDVLLKSEEVLKNLVSKGADNSESLQRILLNNIYTDSDIQSNGKVGLQIDNKLENKDQGQDVNQLFYRASFQHNNNAISTMDVRDNNNAVKALKFSIIEQMAEKISFIHKQNMTTLTVAIKPEWLGNVVIELNKDLHGNITGNIFVSSPHVKEIVESSLGNLLTILKDQGINISQLNVSLGNSSGNQQFQNQQRSSQKQYSFVHTDDAVDTIESLVYEISENVLNLRA
ncbi:flagellar hook-length control protein [Caldicellulosiruptor saccharolyticus DSM 8903]|uniref:Flagellar hook-length control protein n=1 Tax=Caldicellulosiruptor saccharolyticus (strain ATCC 43494 / DSM 8903 / Tp8T 6331) TaxID=351627 RepID=A4XIY1_CALS8|nr:flagellar hook-length control protein FliK [Caldicellulosiruptor saccharolyticus]ABP66866.1 flagellar hook-length control protein [Caldicellulosiruptor saccharolyticus DSM 8903]